MTSKNILFLGSLLFVLLVTSCVAYFLEKYNPMFSTVSPASAEEVALQEITVPVEIEQVAPKAFDGKIDIDTITPEKNITIAPIPESIQKMPKPSTQEIAVQKEQNRTENEKNQSNIKENIKPILIATKINKEIIPKKQIKKVQKPNIKKVTPKKKIMPAPKTKRKIIIEPVILTRTLNPSLKGSLSYEDKLFLQNIAARAKRNRDLSVLLSTSDITPEKRKYLQKIKAFLKQKGLTSKQVKIEINREKREKKFLFSEQKTDKIELSLIERI
jgi:hypothetical protein